jgi:double-stranded uracil-DNA glycosylase
MPILPDLLEHNLKVIFCGTAVSKESAGLGIYYASSNNIFWNILYKIDLTPYQLSPQEYPKLLDFGIGLTDLVKEFCGNDNDLIEGTFNLTGFRQKIWEYQPKVIAFNGKKAAEVFYNHHQINYGYQLEKVGTSVVYVLPSTSGTARKYWDETYWQELGECIKK